MPRLLLGFDYPTCSPAVYIADVRDDFPLTDRGKELILSGNAKRLLEIRKKRRSRMRAAFAVS